MFVIVLCLASSEPKKFCAGLDENKGEAPKEVQGRIPDIGRLTASFLRFDEYETPEQGMQENFGFYQGFPEKT